MRSFVLWTVAVIFMAGASVYQRTTGPTYPKRGDFTVAGESYDYRLVRSQETTAKARVALPGPAAGAEGSLIYRRYPTEDEFTVVPLVEETGEDGPEMVAFLPLQPAAGKIEYRLELVADGDRIAIPSESDAETIILRYKDPVPDALLISHVVAMFFTVLVGMRAGLGAVFAPASARLMSWITLTGMTVGGLVFGPFVQKYAFGAYWTGFPWGYDLTDNKLLVMWLVWLIGCLLVGMPRRSGTVPRGLSPAGRTAVLFAAATMMAVYLIPHSMRGSELKYAEVDAGTPPGEAVGTGRN